MRLIGWLLVIAGLAALGYNFWEPPRGDEFRFYALGELGYHFLREDYLLLEPAITNHVSKSLWDNVVQPLTLFWAWGVPMVGGVVLILLSRLLFGRRRRARA